VVLPQCGSQAGWRPSAFGCLVDRFLGFEIRAQNVKSWLLRIKPSFLVIFHVIRSKIFLERFVFLRNCTFLNREILGIIFPQTNLKPIIMQKMSNFPFNRFLKTEEKFQNGHHLELFLKQFTKTIILKNKLHFV
jgi:hypothetical protein